MKNSLLLSFIHMLQKDIENMQIDQALRALDLLNGYCETANLISLNELQDSPNENIRRAAISIKKEIKYNSDNI